jgi:hypothetical protein
MIELDFDFPEGYLTPEENTRFLKYKADTIAFYEKHGDDIDWLLQARELGLTEDKELTPDDLQYLDEMAKITEKHKDELKNIEGFEELTVSQERFETIKYLQKEGIWLTELLNRKQAEAGRSLLENLEMLLTASIMCSAENPEDKTLVEYIANLKEAITELTSQTTVLELNLDARKIQSEN